jgi:hypothetical protein
MSSRVCDVLNYVNAAHAVRRRKDKQTDVIHSV